LLGPIVEFVGSILRSYGVFNTTFFEVIFIMSAGFPMKCRTVSFLDTGFLTNCRPVSCLCATFCGNVTIHDYWDGTFFVSKDFSQRNVPVRSPDKLISFRSIAYGMFFLFVHMNFSRH